MRDRSDRSDNTKNTTPLESALMTMTDPIITRDNQQHEDDEDLITIDPNADLLEAVSSSSSSSSSSSNRPQSSGKSSKNKNGRHTTSRLVSHKWVFSGVILLLGGAASAAFLAVGINSVLHETNEHFIHEAQEWSHAVYTTLRDYELLSLWTHESCSKWNASRNASDIALEEDVAGHLGFCSRQEFRNLFEHMSSHDVVEFQSVQFLPKVYAEERYELERQSHLYYQEHYDYVEYQGITQPVIDEETGEQSLVPRDEAPFYWPVHLVEPVRANEEALDLDSYSTTQRASIEKAVATFLPVLSGRVRLVQEKDPNAYGVIIQHPGVPTTGMPNNTEPIALSQIVIRVPDLLARASAGVVVNKFVYLHDSTESKTDPDFLGAMSVKVVHGETVLVNLPETSVSDIPHPRASRTFTSELQIVDRHWTVSVVSEEEEVSDLVYVILGGTIIFLASILLAIWFQTLAKWNQLRSAAEAEKSRTARRQVARERYMNEFLSHEVRNPLSSAISALSFVAATVQDSSACQVQDDGVRTTLLYDLRVMDASLQFINELLRNMLDIHRSASKQMKMDLKPTDIRRDILEPVASILFLRGSTSVEVQVDCVPADHLVARTDRMRLKQIVLNLAANAAKFVERGYIRLRARVVEDSNNEHDDGVVEISVEDSGPGIPLEKRNRLFAKFQESLDSLNQGTGIGLAVCKSLSALMGADIWLDETFQSAVDGCPGTRFVMRLNQPALAVEHDNEDSSNANGDVSAAASEEEKTSLLLEAGETAAAATASSALGVSSGEQRLQQQQKQTLPEALSVLFVDDDTILRKMFRRSLKRAAPDWKFEEASNGETALRLTETNTFDIIFVDQYMASIEKQLLGTETVHAMRSRGVDCIICGLSANDMEDQFLRAGANCFLFKPFPCEKDPLIIEILGILGRRNTSEHASLPVSTSRTDEDLV